MGEADAIKRLRSVQVLPPQETAVEVTNDTDTIAATSDMGSCGFNMAAAEFKIKIGVSSVSLAV